MCAVEAFSGTSHPRCSGYWVRLRTSQLAVICHAYREKGGPLKPVERKATAMGGSSYSWFPSLWSGAFFPARCSTDQEFGTIR